MFDYKVPHFGLTVALHAFQIVVMLIDVNGKVTMVNLVDNVIQSRNTDATAIE